METETIDQKGQSTQVEQPTVYTLKLDETALAHMLTAIKKLPFEIASPMLEGISLQIKAQMAQLTPAPEDKTES
jgi:hypothetical protein